MLIEIKSGPLATPQPQQLVQPAVVSVAVDRPLPMLAGPGWIEWIVEQVVVAGSYVRDRTVEGGTVAYSSATNFFHHLWETEGLTPAERQELVATLERIVALEEKKN